MQPVLLNQFAFWREQLTSALLRRWNLHRQLAHLGSRSAEVRESALAWFIAQGEPMLPILRPALRGPMARACGSAVAMRRMGHPEGIYIVLSRCYEEEWLACAMPGEKSEANRALLWLGMENVAAALETALEAATGTRQIRVCLFWLCLALSSERVLPLYTQEPDGAIWRKGLHFGQNRLMLRDEADQMLVWNLTRSIREEAALHLIRHYPKQCYAWLLDALASEDLSVARTAIWSLERLGDRRALVPLQTIAFTPGHPLAAHARQAVERLAGAKADSLTLLRTSIPEVDDSDLLHPVMKQTEAGPPDELLRPARCAGQQQRRLGDSENKE